MALSLDLSPMVLSATAMRMEKDLGSDTKDIVLTAEQCEFFDREGYLSLPAITTASEVKSIRTIYENLFHQKAGWKDGNYLDFAGPDDARPLLPQILMPSTYVPSLKETILFSNCLGIAKQLLGPAAEFVFDHAMTKPANGGVPTPWHQDKAFYTRQTSHETITFWVALQAVSKESGCLRFVPGSNHGRILNHRHLNDDPRIHGLAALDVDERNAVWCPLAAGGATIHHHRTLHGADANVSGEHRWAYAMGFGIRPAMPTVAREYAWNRTRREARQVRFSESLDHWARLKYRLRSTLLRAGIL
jgi:hypothetical protein